MGNKRTKKKSAHKKWKFRQNEKRDRKRNRKNVRMKHGLKFLKEFAFASNAIY